MAGCGVGVLRRVGGLGVWDGLEGVEVLGPIGSSSGFMAALIEFAIAFKSHAFSASLIDKDDASLYLRMQCCTLTCIPNLPTYSADP